MGGLCMNVFCNYKLFDVFLELSAVRIYELVGMLLGNQGNSCFM
jgi:hypothetical protein